MKIAFSKFLFFTFLCASITHSSRIRGNTDYCSKSYFSVRSQFQIGSPEYTTFARSLKKKREDGYGIGLQATVFGGRSTDSKGLGTYFSPFCSPCINVSGKVEENSTSLFTQNFNLFSVEFCDSLAALRDLLQNTDPFTSTIRLKPHQSVVGLGLGYQQAFDLWGIEHWVSISAPIMHVRNSMGLSESVQNPGQFEDVQPIAGQTTNLNQNIRTMTQALSQDDWCFGKIDCQGRNKTGLAFIQLQVGHVLVKNEKNHLDVYAGLTIPTGNKPKAHYLFEPIVGNGGHFGLLWGGTSGMQLWHNCDRDMMLRLETDLTMQYLFKRTQKRSVDLKGRPWSRYVEMYANKAQAQQANALVGGNTNLQSIFLATPGINMLTLDLAVKPKFNATLNMGLVFNHHMQGAGFEGELGYNLYVRQAESIGCPKLCATDAAIKDHIGMGLTNPVRDITTNLLLNEASIGDLLINDPGLPPQDLINTYQRGIVTQKDLDLSSAQHPCMIAHTIYGALGYHWNDMNFPIVLGAGSSYEFSSTNATMDRWLVWGKLGVSF